MLKHQFRQILVERGLQPPSGGCVLKPLSESLGQGIQIAATFGWLCVETELTIKYHRRIAAATFGWLCVETARSSTGIGSPKAATFGWLCVETLPLYNIRYLNNAATFGWLCVETAEDSSNSNVSPGSHLRVAVC